METILLSWFLCMISLADSQPAVSDELCTQNGNVRLVGGSDVYEGNVQVCIGGVWGYVCDNRWSSAEGRIVCRQLGYSPDSFKLTRNSYFGAGNGKVFLDRLSCSFYDKNLTECRKGSITCNLYTDIAGIVCSSSVGKLQPCTNGTIRLYSDSYSGRSEGQVELCYNDRWTRVCQNSFEWSDSNTAVTCAQLGYNGNYSTTLSYSYIPYKPAVFTNISCNGDETSLFNCPKSIVDTAECSNVSFSIHENVRCFSVDNSPCTDGALRLWSAYNNTPSNEGMAQICKNGTWYSVCDSYGSCYIGNIICRSLGFKGVRVLRQNAGLYYGYYNNNDRTRYNCYSSSYTSLSQCSVTDNYFSCGTERDALRVICAVNTTTVSKCTEGDVRLVNGNTNNEGRVEYCYEGTWSPMCSLTTVTAQLVCKKLGFNNYKYVTIDNKRTFGSSKVSTPFNSLNCYSGHTSISQCSVLQKSGCYINSCYLEYGMTCLMDTEECTEGEIRLKGGILEQEGQAEVCFEGAWGAICDGSWNSADAFIFCKTLGYTGSAAPTVYYNSVFGFTDIFPVWNYIRCNGWEKSVFDCSKIIYPSSPLCSGNDAAGVLCKDDCEDGDIRLVGGEYNNEGTVQVCRKNLWGQISDQTWNHDNARVVCRSLGFNSQGAIAKQNSFYGISNLTIHYRTVRCNGNEKNLDECSIVFNSLFNGRFILTQPNISVAGVDCIYDEPTPPPCIANPNIDSSDICTSKGSIKLIKNGVVSTSEGRVEFCNGEFWTPLCSMDNKLAAVTCRQLGHKQYSWGAVVENGEYGSLLNYSLIQNITCSNGSESSITECTIHDAADSCLPWCPVGNIGLRCFTSTTPCNDHSIRLVDGIIDQEGRVEVCVNGVWGTICDDGWDKTDAHIVCQQMGHPELEPYIYYHSRFGDGQYPIVYSQVSCGGWEKTISHCKHSEFNDVVCSRQQIAGVLCGYDCKNGDVRLTDGQSPNEGTVEVCYDHIWGLIDESGWSLSEAQIVCSQLGYTTEGDTVIVRAGSYYGKSNKPVFLSNIQCYGDEDMIDDCTQTKYSLEEGKTKLSSVDVAGVKCGVRDDCVTPPTGGQECNSGEVRLTGASNRNGDVLEYCHNGFWSPFCSLKLQEATVACRQLGHTQTKFVSIFNDGKFNEEQSTSYTSYIENITCPTNKASDLSQCHITDGCEVSCSNPIAIQCFSESDNCEEGAIRLSDGLSESEGRIEMCYNSIWGAICSTGFDFADGFVACKDSDISEPIIYTDSVFGDGLQPIVVSNISCSGSETDLYECSRAEYGHFECSRNNIVGVKCKDNCIDGTVRLIGSQRDTEGTVEVCYKGIWGLVAAGNWDDRVANIICYQLGYNGEDAVSFNDSRYGRPNIPVLYKNVFCIGTEDFITDCYYSPVSIENSDPSKGGDIIGVSCTRSPLPQPSSQSNIQTTSSGDIAMTVTVGFLAVMLLIAIAIIMGIAILYCIKSKSSNLSIRSTGQPGSALTMSTINPIDEDSIKNTLSTSASFDEKIIPL